MKLEDGKYYKTRDGRKAGPIKTFDDSFRGPVEGDIPNKGDRVWSAGGIHAFNELEIDLVEEWTTVDIKMDGKYAYRRDPFTQVRILCVDRPNHPKKPIMSMGPDGWVNTHKPDGSSDYGGDDDLDLVTLQEKAPDLWVLKYTDGSTLYRSDKKHAENILRDSTSSPKPKLIRYIPAPDQTS